MNHDCDFSVTPKGVTNISKFALQCDVSLVLEALVCESFIFRLVNEYIGVEQIIMTHR